VGDEVVPTRGVVPVHDDEDRLAQRLQHRLARRAGPELRHEGLGPAAAAPTTASSLLEKWVKKVHRAMSASDAICSTVRRSTPSSSQITSDGSGSA
jgi:hypothetical protein